LPGRTYRFRIEFFTEASAPAAAPGGSLTVEIGGNTLFRHPLGSGGATGWQQREVVFPAQVAEANLVIRLDTSSLSREESTVAIDNVEVTEAPEVTMHPFRRGYPLSPILDHKRLPFGLDFGSKEKQLAGYDAVNRFHRITGQTTALLAWHFDWDPASAASGGFSEVRQDVEPWVQCGVLPILTAHGEPPLDLPDGALEPYFRGWGRELADWGYPVILRPWPGMERTLPPGSAPQWISLWRRIHGWFQDEGASNVLWFWTPEVLSSAADPFYPGDAVVDFVGSPEGPATLAAIDEHFRRHYRRKALAIPGTEIPGTLGQIDAQTASVLRDFPRIAFFVHPIEEANLSPNRVWASNPAWKGQAPQVQFRMLQQGPVRAVAHLSRRGNTVRAIVINVSEEGTPGASDVTVEFFSGDPNDGGVPLGAPRVVRLSRGQERSLEQTYREGDSSVPHVKITAPPGPGTMPGIPTSEMTFGLWEAEAPER
jgi:hypothetical protein